MSQVDYLHFFNNVFITNIQFIIFYFFICVVIFQGIYKILRLRFLAFDFVNKFLMEKLLFCFKLYLTVYELKNKIRFLLKNLKVNSTNYCFQKSLKCYYE